MSTNLETVETFRATIYNQIVEDIQDAYLADNHPWVVGFSGGKDSTILLQLIYKAILKLQLQRNNNPTNGIALSKNAHWLFDQGLWTIDDNYRVIIALGKFSETCPNDRALKDYHGEQILLPEDIKLRPNPVQLTWHRKNRFLGE